ncbi:putative selenium-dependent hydroxylase accessory protein YqeC [Geobacter argillaceus]|uniref:Putative selenium-dependent hydroxylase accessory protein YqeC n=2 Tax=Geobacter argillaceus TaxID=345631 RepID=A0A562V5I2_9BACT|nr:putative selenium-dependent hydroxylase accessory protein YqeC [Geobacter argillaceus]
MILELEPRGVMSFVGGGGKTSLMFHLARQLALAGMRVLTTTTTKIFVPTAEQSATVLVARDPHEVLEQAATGHGATRHLTAAAERMADTGKLKGFAPEAIATFVESGRFDWILVEADGAARRPLKAPADHEPVIPEETTILIAVAGLEVVGSPLGEELVFRSGLAGELMGLSPGECITEQAMARLIAHPQGAFKGAPAESRRFVFLNKADTLPRREAATRVAGELQRQAPHAAEAVIVGQALDGISIHAVHQLGGPQ